MSTEPGDIIQTRLQLLGKLENAVQVVRRILEAAAARAPLEAERRLTAAPMAFEELDSVASQLTDSRVWRVVRDELEVRAAEVRIGFGASLERALTEAGIPWSGVFPTYKVRSSVRLEIDTGGRRVRIGRRVLPLGDVADITRSLSRVPKTPARESVEIDFEQELATAYAAAAEAAGVSSGDYVSIGKVYEAIKKRMPKGYSRERFASDLASMSQRGERFEFAAARHPRHGIRVPPGDGSVVGSLRPRAS
jgi:hypothetical protein